MPHAAVASDIYQKVTLEKGIVLSVKKKDSNRSLPHAYYDQAISSIQNIYPKHELLAKRRFGKIGKIQYSIICYKENMKSGIVDVSGNAVYKNKAWYFETHIPSASFGEDLLIVLEAVESLPSNKALQPIAKSGG